jgi:AcrR family transcriptional regulator
MKKKRLLPADRETEILEVALRLAAVKGYARVTREEIATAAGCSSGLVSRYLGTMTQCRRVLMRKAIERELVKIVAQGLADGNPHAKKASPELKARAAQLLAA